MHFFQLVAWLFPCAVCATMEQTAPAPVFSEVESTEHDRSSSPAFSVGVVKAVGSVSDEESKGRRRLRKSRSPQQPRTVVDTRESEEAVASAISYCKETYVTHRRGKSSSPPSLSLVDGWVPVRQEEGTASAAAAAASPSRRDVSLVEMLQEESTARAVDARYKCNGSQSPGRRARTAAAECGSGESSAAQTSKPSPSDPAGGDLEICGIFDELVILHKFGENDEIISRYFNTIYPHP